MALSNAEKQARHRERTREKLAEFDHLKRRVKDLENKFDGAVAQRVSSLPPADLLRAFQTMPLEDQGEFLDGLWRSMADRPDCSLVITLDSKSYLIDLAKNKIRIAGNHMLISVASRRELRIEGY